MRKIQTILLACLGVTSLVAYSSVYAGNRPGALTVSASGGYEYMSYKRHVKNTDIGVAQIGYNLTENWGVEGLVGVFTTKFKTGLNDNKHVHGALYAFNGVYHFLPSSMIEPYVLAGVGVTGMNPSYSDANNEGNINAALGAQLFLNNSFALRMEARDLYTWVGGKNDLLLTAGISVLIDFC